MQKMSVLILLRRSVFPLFLVSFLLAGCGGGGGGGSASSSSFSVLTVRTESGLDLPIDNIHLNEPLVLVFSSPVDPASVTIDSVRIRRRRRVNGMATGEAYSVPALGVFQVEENRVTFVPSVPTRSDFGDAGLTQDSLYRIELPGSPELDAVRSNSGARLSDTVLTTFHTRSSHPLVLDPIDGAPFVISVGLDLDGNGFVDADGDPSTESREEIHNFDVHPFRTGVPVGLARQPMIFAVVLSEPILAESLFIGTIPDVTGNRAFLVDRSTGARIASRIDMTLDLIEGGQFHTRITFKPTSTLPPRTQIEVHLQGIKDLVGNEIAQRELLTTFETQISSEQFDDALRESFEDRFNMDPETTAAWNIAESRTLEASVGIGGSGLDGEFLAPDGFTTILDTDINGGRFNFTEFEVESGATLEIVGSNPLRIFCQRDVKIAGLIDATGKNGETGRLLTAPRTARAGAGVAGGTRGGNSGHQQNYIEGGGPDGTGGGQGGISRIRNPGGGGGGGFSRRGGSLSTVGNRWAGRGGLPYGVPQFSNPLAGSGGAGGGHYDHKNYFQSGGGGGGGGGAVAFEVGGTFFFSGSASIDTDGGNGGHGGLGLDGDYFGAGGGGGGSGGSIWVRAVQIEFDTTSEARLGAVGGDGGLPGGGHIGGGGGGAPGRIYFETRDHNRDGQQNDFSFDQFLRIIPAMAKGILPEDDLGKSVAISRFLDTGNSSPAFEFDGNDPDTGFLKPDDIGRDVTLREELPRDAIVSIQFQGVHGKIEAERTPDLNTLSEYTPRIEDLDGYRFIRYRIEFDLGPDLGTRQRPKLDSLQIRFRFGI